MGGAAARRRGWSILSRRRVGLLGASALGMLAFPFVAAFAVAIDSGGDRGAVRDLAAVAALAANVLWIAVPLGAAFTVVPRTSRPSPSREGRPDGLHAPGG